MYQSNPPPNNPDRTNMIDFEKGVVYAIHQIARILTSGHVPDQYGWTKQQFTQNTWYENKDKWCEDNYYRTFISHSRKLEKNWGKANSHCETAFHQKMNAAFTPIFQQRQQKVQQMQQVIHRLKQEVERLTVQLKHQPTTYSNN